MIYTHVLNKGGMGVKSPLDMTDSFELPHSVAETMLKANYLH